MNTQLTDEQCSSYRDNGYLVVRGFLSASELSELRAGIDEAVAQLGRRKLSGSTGDGCGSFATTTEKGDGIVLSDGSEGKYIHSWTVATKRTPWR